MTLRWICSVKSVSCLNFRANTRHSIPDIVSSVLIREEGSPLLKGMAMPFLIYLRILFSLFVVRVHHWFLINKVSSRTQGPSLKKSFSAGWSLRWMTDWGYLFVRQDFALPFVKLDFFLCQNLQPVMNAWNGTKIMLHMSSFSQFYTILKLHEG